MKSMTNKRTYYSARTDNQSNKKKFDLDALKELFLGSFRQFRERDYFQQAFGHNCVDAGYIDGIVGSDIRLYFYKKLKKRNLWPIDQEIAQNYNEADIFDVIELLYDVVSKPLDGQYHSWNDCGWHYSTFDKESGQQEFQAEINELLEEYSNGFELSDTGQVISKDKQFDHLGSQTYRYSSFDTQFKFGLPISLQKPLGTVEHTETGQDFKFEENDNVGILRGDIYPNFCAYDAHVWIRPNSRLNSYAQPNLVIHEGESQWTHKTWTVLYNLCQTSSEKTFFEAYIRKYILPYKSPNQKKTGYTFSFNRLRDKVPMLIPQAWINWSSDNKEALNRMGYKGSNLPYRLDFIAFWNYRNFVVMIDGIEHYAQKVGNRWDAKEEKYAARLKEDRLLRMQGWNVFRIGNWETKDADKLDQVLNELRKFIGFEEPPILPSLQLDEDIPF